MPILKDMQVQYITDESGERSSVILSIGYTCCPV